MTQIVAGGGRNGTQGMRITGAVQTVSKTFPASTSTYLGFACNPTTAQGPTLLTMNWLGSAQVTVNLNRDFTLSVVVGANTYNAPSSPIPAGGWSYIELGVVYGSGTSGSFVLKVNGTAILTQSGINTNPRAASPAQANGMTFGCAGIGSTAFTMDDLYLCDGTGSYNNTFLGDVMVQAYYSSGAGDVAQWTPDAGSNYQRVHEVLCDDDASYNAAGTAGYEDLYAMGDIAGTPASIFGIQWNGIIRKADASAYVLYPLLKTDGTEYTPFPSGGIAPNITYVCYTQPYDVSPSTGLPWTLSEFNAIQAGLQLYSVI